MMTLAKYKPWNAYALEAWPTVPTTCVSSVMVSCDPDTPTPEPEIGIVGRFVCLSYIQSGDRRFALRRGLVPYLKQEGALWSCELDDLHIMGYGYSLKQAITRFMEDFAVAYDGLVGVADEHLTADARQLRDALSDLVAQITPIEYGLDVDLQRPRASTAVGMCLCATQ